MLKFNHFVTAFFILLSQMGQAQETLNNCGNIGVETGSFEHWNGLYGSWAADYANEKIIYTSKYFGIREESHRIRSISDGNVPEVTNDAIPFVPPGSQYAIQLGNSRKGAEYERLWTSFMVDAQNSLFQYRFAVIFEDPSHEHIEQPKFEISVSDENGEIIPCGYYQVTAGSGIEGFKVQGNIKYRDWTTAAVDLRAYIGRVLTVTITSYDCAQGGHWGMALFDAFCSEAKIQTVNFCPNSNTGAKLEAPEGFQHYEWSTGQTGRSIYVEASTLDQKINVKFSPYSSLHDSCRLSMDFELPGIVHLLEDDKLSFCGDTLLTVAPKDQSSDFSYHWFPGGETTPAIKISKAGEYILEAVKGTCTLRDTILIALNKPPILDFDFKNPACDGQNDGYLSAIVKSDEPVNYRWSNQATTPSIGNLTAGLYRLTVTGSQSGCIVKKEHTLTQSTPVFADATVSKIPLCINWGDGRAEVKATAGTPPYRYKWSNGSQTNFTALKTGGQYYVTVTDSLGCQAIDHIEVKPIRAAIETSGNMCRDGQAGAIEINAFDGKEPYEYALENTLYQVSPVFKGLGTGVYQVQVKDADGCVRAFSTEVKDMRAMPFEVQLPADTAISLGDELDIAVQSNYPVGSVDWAIGPDGVMSPDSSTVTLRPVSSTTIKINAKDEYGCPAEDRMLVTVKKDYGIFIPNVFYPYGGGEGDDRFYFSTGGNNVKDVVKCQIFDRWGNMVFEDFDFEPNNPQGGWDGKVNGTLMQPAVFAYRLEVEFIDGERRVFFGDVTLVR